MVNLLAGRFFGGLVASKMVPLVSHAHFSPSLAIFMSLNFSRVWMSGVSCGALESCFNQNGKISDRCFFRAMLLHGGLYIVLVERDVVE